MTAEEISGWSSREGIAVYGVMRGSEFAIPPAGRMDKPPRMEKVLHWLLEIRGKRYALSPSDMEKLLAGKLPLEFFTKTSHSRER